MGELRSVSPVVGYLMHNDQMMVGLDGNLNVVADDAGTALPHLYRARNLVDRFFNKIKQCRRVATRYDKLAANNLAFISITAADLLNSVCATHSHYVSFVISAQTLGTSQLGCRRSIQSRMRVRADLSSGTSSASSKRPIGNIQKPKMGRKPSNPPQIRSIAAARRIHADAGRLNHRTAAFSRGGSRPIS